MSTTFDLTVKKSKDKLEELIHELNVVFSDDADYRDICVYVCGSLGRQEITDASDLDLFFIANLNSKEGYTVNNLLKYRFFPRFLEVSKKLNYPMPSKQGAYWEFILKQDLLDIGSRQEDYNNSLTARMLLLLESKPIYNEKGYDALLTETVEKYFIDYPDYPDSFSPLFLMNDILRYWYTLTLNYEYRRDDKDSANIRNWKRLKLKYARLITCFSMLACLYKEKVDVQYVVKCAKLTPFERLHMLAEENEDIKEIVKDIREEYEWYLNLREEKSNWWDNPKHKDEAFTHAGCFHSFVIHKLMQALAKKNPDLYEKMDIY